MLAIIIVLVGSLVALGAIRRELAEFIFFTLGSLIVWITILAFGLTALSAILYWPVQWFILHGN